MKVYLVVEGDYESRPVGAFDNPIDAENARSFYQCWSSEDVRVRAMELNEIKTPRKVDVLAEKANGKWEITAIRAAIYENLPPPYFGHTEADFQIDLVKDKDQDWHREEALRVLREKRCEDDSLAERFGVKED